MCIYNFVVGFTMEPQDCFCPSSRKWKEKDEKKYIDLQLLKISLCESNTVITSSGYSLFSNILILTSDWLVLDCSREMCYIRVSINQDHFCPIPLSAHTSSNSHHQSLSLHISQHPFIWEACLFSLSDELPQKRPRLQKKWDPLFLIRTVRALEKRHWFK